MNVIIHPKKLKGDVLPLNQNIDINDKKKNLSI